MSTKTIQGDLWSIAPEYWSKHFEPWFLPLYRETLTQLELTENDSVLDAGCGSGLFSSMAIATGADVIGIDAAPGLLEIARKRNPNNNFLEGDLEAIPFKENTFDVVVGFNSFQYAGSFSDAIAEAKRVLKPGGKLVAAIWAMPELSDATHVLKSIGTLLPPPAAGSPGPFALSENGKVESILAGHQLKLLSRKQVSCPFLYQELGDGIKSFMGTGPAAAALKQNEKSVVEKTIAKALGQFRVADDYHFLQNHFLLFVAEK